MIRRHPAILTACFALWGLAVAFSLYPLLTGPAPPGQPAGYATAHDIDARGPYRVAAMVVILPIAFALMAGFFVRHLADAAAERWAGNAAALVMLGALWISIINRDLWWTAGFVAAFVAACVALRRFRARFSRRDAILLPTILTVFLAVHDIARALAIEKAFFLAAIVVFAVRIAVAAIPSASLPAYAFLATPLALALQTPFFARDQRYLGWPSLILALLGPFVLRFFLRNDRFAARLLVFVAYPIAVYCYASAASIEAAEGKPRVNLFEAGHGLLPASEMLRGERPYRDILPGHGLAEDGLLDYLTLRFRGETIGDVMKTRVVLSGLKTVALYALTAAATGSPDIAIVAPLLAQMTGFGGNGIRELPAIIGLTLVVCAVRRRRPRFFAAAAAMVVVSGFTSLDFALFTFVALVAAIVRFPMRREAARAALIGFAAAGIPAFLILAITGVVFDFVRGTFVEIVTLGPAYALSPFTAPEALQRNAAIPEVIAALFDLSSFLYVAWFVVLIYLAVMLARSPLRSVRRHEPYVVIAAWIVFSAISYAERHHLYFRFVIFALIVAMIFRLFRQRSPFAPLAVIVLLAIARPTTHIAIVGWLRHARGPIEPRWVEINDVPRARGALFREDDAAFVSAAKKYLDRMPPDQTFFDFTNHGVLYFFFDRDAPIRQYEVAFYQREDRQREVIERLQGNPNVRAALIPTAPGVGAVDAVANVERAPLVWKYLQENFEPDFQEGWVSFWRRK